MAEPSDPVHLLTTVAIVMEKAPNQQLLYINQETEEKNKAINIRIIQLLLLYLIIHIQFH